MNPLPCPRCSKVPRPYCGGYGVSVACDNCYDATCEGDPPQYVSGYECGNGMSPAEAIADWNTQVEEANETEGA